MFQRLYTTRAVFVKQHSWNTTIYGHLYTEGNQKAVDAVDALDDPAVEYENAPERNPRATRLQSGEELQRVSI